MPQAIIPFIPLIAAGVGGGVTLGTELAGVGQPSSNLAQQQQQLQTAQQQQAQAASLQQQKAIQANLANSQEQTGGEVNAPGLVSLASIISGLPGAGSNTPNSPGSNALAGFLGTGQQPNSGENLVSATYGSLNGGQG